MDTLSEFTGSKLSLVVDYVHLQAMVIGNDYFVQSHPSQTSSKYNIDQLDPPIYHLCVN